MIIRRFEILARCIFQLANPMAMYICEVGSGHKTYMIALGQPNATLLSCYLCEPFHIQILLNRWL